MYTTLRYITTCYIAVGGHVSFIYLMGGHVSRNIYYRTCRETQWTVSDTVTSQSYYLVN